MSVNCTNLIKSGVVLDCKSLSGMIGAGKDLILVNYEDFDYDKTFADDNKCSDVGAPNEGGIENIYLKANAVQHLFEGTDNSVKPTVTAEQRENGNSWYVHSIAFISYSKKSKDRYTLRDLGNSRVIAITIDNSTKLFELFGAEQGLKVGSIERNYTDGEISNFYSVTIATPDVQIIRESGMGELAKQVNTAPAEY